MSASFVLGSAQFALSVFLVPMEEELGWSRSLIFGALSMRFLLAGLLGPFAGPWTDRESAPRIILPAGVLLLAISLGAMRWVESPLWFFFWYGGVGAVGSALIHLTMWEAVVLKWFARRRTRALVVGGLGEASGPMIFPLLVTVLVSGFGWRDAWLWYGVIAMAVLMPFALLVRTRPEHVGQLPDGRARPSPARYREATAPGSMEQEPERPANAPRHSGENGDPGAAVDPGVRQGDEFGGVPPESAGCSPSVQPEPNQPQNGGLQSGAGAAGIGAQSNIALTGVPRDAALRTQAFWVLGAAYMLSGFVITGFQSHWVPYFRDEGFSAEVAAGAVSIYGLFNIFSRLLWGGLTARFALRTLMIAHAFAAGVGIVALLTLVSNEATLFVWAAYQGLVLGSFFSLHTFISADFFGRAHIGAIRGLWMLPTALSRAAGPLVIGAARDVRGAYGLVFWGVVVGWGVMAALIGSSRRPRQGG